MDLNALARRLVEEAQPTTDRHTITFSGDDQPIMLLGVDYKEGEIADLYPRGPQPIASRMMLSGKLLVPEAFWIWKAVWELLLFWKVIGELTTPPNCKAPPALKAVTEAPV